MKYSSPDTIHKTAESAFRVPPDGVRRSYKAHRIGALRMFQSYAELFKIRIALFAALSAATGSIIATSRVTAGTFISAAGVFLLACGAGAMNQFQERNLDANMHRTRMRPIPSGRIKPLSALYTAAFLVLTGLLVLSLSGSMLVSGLGIFAVLWYNLLYTGLKKITAFAAVPGALTGAVPPAIGWVIGGGHLSDVRLAAIWFFFFMWQVPHFWLLLLIHAEDYRSGKTPSLNKLFGPERLAGITAVWISAVAVSSLFMPFYGIATATFSFALLSGAGWLFWSSLTLYRQKGHRPAAASAFRNINIYMAVVMLTLIAGSLF